jgi:hypothetical protein
MNELFPVASGLLIGCLIGGLRPQLRIAVGGLLSIAAGAAATVISGEFRMSWEYLLVDIPLVALSAYAGFLIARTLVARRLEGTWPTRR